MKYINERDEFLRPRYREALYFGFCVDLQGRGLDEVFAV